MRVVVTALVRDEGSLVILQGLTDDNQVVNFAADHRCAQAILDAVAQGEDVEVELEDWQILGVIGAL